MHISILIVIFMFSIRFTCNNKTLIKCKTAKGSTHILMCVRCVCLLFTNVTFSSTYAISFDQFFDLNLNLNFIEHLMGNILGKNVLLFTQWFPPVQPYTHKTIRKSFSFRLVPLARRHLILLYYCRWVAIVALFFIHFYLNQAITKRFVFFSYFDHWFRYFFSVNLSNTICRNLHHQAHPFHSYF